MNLTSRYLADPTRCPACEGALGAGVGTCPACGVVLTSPTAGRLWQVSVQAAELLTTRARLIEVLRAESAAARTSAPAGPAGPAGPAAPSGPATAPAPEPAQPRPEWSPRKVQNLLLALGVGLLGVAAVIFLAVSWTRLGVGGRVAVMAAVTALAGVAAVRANRRGLTSTGEWLALLTMVLALLDCAGARAAGLAGLERADGLAFWSGASALVALLSGLLLLALPSAALRLSAALLAQLTVPLLALHLADRADEPVVLVATALTAQSMGALAIAAWWPGGPRSRDARMALAVGGASAFALACVSSVVVAFDGPLAVGVVLLLVLAVTAAAAGTVLGARQHGPLVPVLDTVAGLLVLGAAWVVVVEQGDRDWVAVLLVVTAGVLLGATALLPGPRRGAPGLVFLGVGVLPVLVAGDAVSQTASEMLAGLVEPWESRAADIVAVADGPATVLLLAAGALLALGAQLRGPATPQGRGLLMGAVPLLAAGAAMSAPALGASYQVALGAQVALGGVLLAGAAPLLHRGRGGLGAMTAAAAGGLLGLAGAWAFAVDVATLVTLPALAVVLVAGAAVSRAAASLRPARVVLVTGAMLLAVVETGALARYDGAGWAQVWTVFLALLTAAGVTVALALSLRTSALDRFWAPLHTAALVVATIGAVGCAGSAAVWAGTTLAGGGLAAAVTASALLALTALPVPARPRVRAVLPVVTGIAGVPGLALTAPDGDLLWLALLALGLGVAVVASRPARHRWGWAAGGLLVASSWVRLTVADVDAPEAYTAPGGVALLALGALRRRQDPDYGSWRAHGSGLSLVLVPSLLRAVTDAGEVRPLLLALVASAVLAAGVTRRLQAPLVLGAGVLAVDALVQLTPYLVLAYDAVPRWVTIGLLGLVLVGAGATYEQRVRDLRRLGGRVARLG